MVHSRTVRHTLFVLVALTSAACTAYTSPDASTTDTTSSSDSALVVSKPSADAKTLTVTSDDGKCGDAFTLVDAHKTDLQALCKNGEVPMPADVVNTDCDEGQVTSITFKCVVAHMPPPRPQGCWQIPVKDDHHAIPACGANQFAALPPMICPMLGGAPPPPPFANGRGGQPGAQQGGQQGAPGPQAGDPNAQQAPGGPGGFPMPGPNAGPNQGPSAGPNQGPPGFPPPNADGRSGGAPNGGAPNAGAPNAPPMIECCAPGQNGGPAPGQNGSGASADSNSQDDTATK